MGLGAFFGLPNFRVGAEGMKIVGSRRRLRRSSPRGGPPSGAGLYEVGTALGVVGGDPAAGAAAPFDDFWSWLALLCGDAYLDLRGLFRELRRNIDSEWHVEHSQTEH